MKEILALLFFISLTIVTIYLNVTKQINTTVTALLLVFTLSGGFLIANYDIIKKLKYKDVEIETFERKVAQVKENALEEVRRDVEKQKQSLGEISDTLTKMAYVVADGAGRFGGTPKIHMKKLEEYRTILHNYTDPNLDVEIKKTIEALHKEIEKQNK